mgnify:FL=1
MANPLGNAPQPPANPFFQLVKQIKSGQANPQAIVQMLVQNNPQVAQQIDRLRGQNGKISYQDLAFSVMRQRGIDPNAFMAQFR